MRACVCVRACACVCMCVCLGECMCGCSYTKKCGVIYDTVKCLSHQIWSGYHFHSAIYYTNGVISTLHFYSVLVICLSTVYIHLETPLLLLPWYVATLLSN